jgi:hypothetical protein
MVHAVTSAARAPLALHALATSRLVLHAAMLIPAFSVLVGCGPQTISPELRYVMAQPVRCETAAREIALLREVRPDRTRQTMTVLNSLSPPGIAGMVATKDFENRRRVVSGEHGNDIDRRIAEIEARCGRR